MILIIHMMEIGQIIIFGQMNHIIGIQITHTIGDHGNL